ncbi:hypothetical protein KDL30_08525 [bacterium]|nr:hypothetical protein [bacterium]
MKRLTWLVGFTIVILAMPLAAWAGGSAEGGNRQKQEQRVEVRVEREGGAGRREGRRDGEKARDRRGDDGERGGGWRDGGMGRDGGMMRRWMDGMGGDRMGLRDHAMRMFRGIHDRAMNIHFQPNVSDSQVAVGFGNKNVTADTINININIGDVNIAGNSLEGGDAGEMIEMIMEMMMKSHGQGGPGAPSGMWSPHGPDGPGMHGDPGGPGMQGPQGGPGNNGPGPWHEHFDGSRPPVPGMPPHEMHPEMNDGEWHGMLDGGEGLKRAQFVSRDDDGRIVRYEMLIQADEAPVEPGEVRSPYHDFYFGSGRMPERAMEIVEEHIVEGQPMPPHTAQQDASDMPMMHEQIERYILREGPDSAHRFHEFMGDPHWDGQPHGFQGQFDMRPEVMELAMQIPDEIPVEFVEMIFTLGRMAWEDPALAEQIRDMVAAHQLSEHVDKQEIKRLIEEKLRSAQQDQR